MTLRAGQSGYTLIEIVVAMSVLSLSLGALSEIYSVSTRRGERALNLGDAALLASSLTDRLGADVPLDGLVHAAHEGRCDWTVSSHEAAPSGAEPPAAHGFRVHVDVRCGRDAGRRQVVLDLFKLAEPSS